MLVHRLRRSPNIKPTLGECKIGALFAYSIIFVHYFCYQRTVKMRYKVSLALNGSLIFLITEINKCYFTSSDVS